MTYFSSEMKPLARKMGASFGLHDPMRHEAPDRPIVRVWTDTVEEAECLLDSGMTAAGFALACFTPFLLAAAIGYDGYIVSHLGETMAEFLLRSTSSASDEELIELGKKFGLDGLEEYIHGHTREQSVSALLRFAAEQVEYNIRPNGLKVGFWAICILASDFDLSATGIPASVSEAARIYRAFANAS